MIFCFVWYLKTTLSSYCVKLTSHSVDTDRLWRRQAAWRWATAQSCRISASSATHKKHRAVRTCSSVLTVISSIRSRGFERQSGRLGLVVLWCLRNRTLVLSSFQSTNEIHTQISRDFQSTWSSSSNQGQVHSPPTHPTDCEHQVFNCGAADAKWVIDWYNLDQSFWTY